MDGLYSFAGLRHLEAEGDPEVVGQHRTPCATAPESRLLLEVVVGVRDEASATQPV